MLLYNGARYKMKDDDAPTLFFSLRLGQEEEEE